MGFQNHLKRSEAQDDKHLNKRIIYYMTRMRLGKRKTKVILRHLLTGITITSLATLCHAQNINDVINSAIQSNPQILAAEKNKQSIDETITQSRAGFYPKVQTSASYGPTTNDNVNTVGSSGGSKVNMPQRLANLTINQMVFDGFSTKGEVLRTTARANSAAYQVLILIQDTAFNASQAYIDILKEIELVRLAQENLKQHDEIMRTVRLRARTGLSTHADLSLGEGRVALARSTLFDELNNQRDAITRYIRVVGQYPQHIQDPPVLPTSAFPRSVKEAVNYALRHHPTIKSAQFDINAAHQQHDVANARNYPRVDVQVGVDRNANVAGVRGYNMDQFVLAKLSYDIYTGGAITSRQKETAYQVQQAKQLLQNSYRQATQDTTFAWNSLLTARKLLPLLRTHSNSTITTIIAYKKQFQLGKRTLLDLLDVQNESFVAHHAYIDGRYKIKVAEFKLLHSIGNLAQTLHLPLPEETSIYVFD